MNPAVHLHRLLDGSSQRWAQLACDNPILRSNPQSHIFSERGRGGRGYARAHGIDRWIMYGTSGMHAMVYPASSAAFMPTKNARMCEVV
jgi:hypothetical protein